MITNSSFASDFAAAVIDYPAAPPDRMFSAEGSGHRATMISVEPLGDSMWTASFSGPDPGRRALFGLLGTPSRNGLCVVERGTAFVGDVLNPEGFAVVAMQGPVVSVANLVAEQVLLLLTPWAITAVGPGGVQWTTSRIAIDGLRADEACDGWVKGVADPDDEEPRRFAVDLGTGQVEGGSLTRDQRQRLHQNDLVDE